MIKFTHRLKIVTVNKVDTWVSALRPHIYRIHLAQWGMQHTTSIIVEELEQYFQEEFYSVSRPIYRFMFVILMGSQ